jgi:hypothetical protein
MTRSRIWSPQVLAWVAFLLFALLTFSAIALRPTDVVIRTGKELPDSYERITFIRPIADQFISFCGLGCVVIAVIAAAVASFRKNVWGALLALVVVSLCPASAVVSFVRNLAPWHICSELQAPDGSVYYFMESSFLQGQTLALTRLREDRLLTRTVDVLAATNGDNPQSYLRIVRPAGADDEYGKLYLTHDSFLLGLRTENRCFLAYDLKANRAFGNPSVAELSPFICLDAATGPHEPDVARLLATGIEAEKGSPKRAVVVAATHHPNPRVRAIAEKLLADE